MKKHPLYAAVVLFLTLAAPGLLLSGCPQTGGTETEEPAQYTITFESHGGSAVAAITGDAGTAVEKPADPAQENYAFDGWFSSAEGGTAYTWPHTLNASVTMHAR
jgi:hypothetical protein